MFGTTSVQAGWVKDWWDNVYQTQVKQQQYKKIFEDELKQCHEKIEYYTTAVDKHPKSAYYEMKLKQWTDKCSESP